MPKNKFMGAPVTGWYIEEIGKIKHTYLFSHKKVKLAANNHKTLLFTFEMFQLSKTKDDRTFKESKLKFNIDF